MTDHKKSASSDAAKKNSDKIADKKTVTPKPLAPEQSVAPEIGGRKGPEPTRYGDWEKNGLISDF